MPCPDWLAQEHPVFVKKLYDDQQITDPQREAFFDEVANSTSAADPERNRVVDDICAASRNGLGSPVNQAKKYGFGRAHPLSSYKKALEVVCGLPANDLEHIMTMDVHPQKNKDRFDLLHSYLESAPTQQSPLRSPIWAFYNPTDPDGVYAGVQPETLPCRLGLPDDRLDHREYVYLTLTLPTDGSARKPTIFHASIGFQHIWEPGGKSKPRPACASSHPQGLEEAVLDAVPLDLIKPAF